MRKRYLAELVMVAALAALVAGCGTPARSNLHGENIYIWNWAGSGPNKLAYCMDYAEGHPYVAAQMARANGEYAQHAVLVGHATQLRACMLHNIRYAYGQAAPATTDPVDYVRACMWALWPAGEE